MLWYSIVNCVCKWIDPGVCIIHRDLPIFKCRSASISFTHYVEFPLRLKSDVHTTLQNFLVIVPTHFDCTIGTIQCDNGTEFEHIRFDDELQCCQTRYHCHTEWFQLCDQSVYKKRHEHILVWYGHQILAAKEILHIKCRKTSMIIK